jgi:hypothetical protein
MTLSRARHVRRLGRDNGFQPWYPTVIVEPRYVGDILEGIEADGLDFNRGR